MLAIDGRKGVGVLAETLEAHIDGERLHYVILDTAPSVGSLQNNGLWAADMLLIPSAVDHLSLEGAREILYTLAALERPVAPAVRVLPTFYDEVTRESAGNLARLREAFGAAVLDPIHRAAVLRECPAFGETIFERYPNSRAAFEYGALVREVAEYE